MDLDQLKYADLKIITELCRSNSLRDLARTKGYSIGHISKRVSKIEELLGNKVINRSRGGVTMTEFGQHISGYFEEALASLGKLQELPTKQTLSIGSTSFFSTYVLTKTLTQLDQFPIRLMDFQPKDMVLAGMMGAFSIGIYMGELDWPKSWITKEVGQVEWQLCCSSNHEIGERPSQERVAQFPFAVPVYWNRDGIVKGSDLYPEKFKRTIHIETSTAITAVEALLNSSCLAFLPAPCIHDAVQSGSLRIVKPKGLKRVVKPVSIAAHGNLVKNKTFINLEKTLKNILSSF